MLDRIGPGGQAGTSSKIENYMGFPTGLSGSDLANRAMLQAEKFGATLFAPAEVVRLTSEQRLSRARPRERRGGFGKMHPHRVGSVL